MQAQPLITVTDVQASSLWYQGVLELQSGHGGPDYEQLIFKNSVVLQLHHWDAHDHPHLGNPKSKPYGNGVVLWFKTDAFDATVKRTVALQVTVLEPVKVNLNARHREIWLRDPDGYTVVLASAHGDIGQL